jgi:hypothetical protein
MDNKNSSPYPLNSDSDRIGVGNYPHHFHPYSFALNSVAFVKDILEANSLDSIFTLPLSQEAMQELDHLQNSMPELELNENTPDQWKPAWGTVYTTKKFYLRVYDLFQAHPIFKIVWNVKGTPRIKFFFWLILVDRLNTKTMLSKRHIGERNNDHCVLCSLGENETLEHLFFLCPFASQCWNRLGFTWDLHLSLDDRLSQANRDSNLDFFTEATMIAAWELWKNRNDKVLNRNQPSHQRWLQNFNNQGFLQSVRFSTDLRSAFCFWLDAFS